MLYYVGTYSLSNVSLGIRPELVFKMHVHYVPLYVYTDTIVLQAFIVSFDIYIIRHSCIVHIYFDLNPAIPKSLV